MVSETLQPLIKELPNNEKWRLLEWLKSEVNAEPIKENTELSDRLKAMITKNRRK